MSSLESNKTLAGIGAILSFIPVVGIIGIILLLIGMKGLADYYKDESIWQNSLWAFVFGLIGIITLTVFALSGGIFSGLAIASGAAAIIGAILFFLLILVVAFVFYVLMAIYFRKALSSLAQRSGEHLFETAGFVLFIGAILTIILIGFVIVIVAMILAAVAFFTIKAPAVQPNAYTPPAAPVPSSYAPATAPSAATTAPRYCPNCGAPLQPDAAFCSNCGKPLK